MTARCTVVVHTRLAGHMARVDAARRGASGVQIMTMGQLAGRLAGGFMQPIEADPLHEAVRGAIATSRLGDLEPIQTLIKWFNPTKGYGFIQPQDGGKDVFVHISAVERARLSTLNEGQQVEYEIEENRRPPR
jgi:CspA family cold shock protein